MKILVTGAKGFIGKNLVATLRATKEHEVFEYDVDTPTEQLSRFCRQAEFVYHLAGVNRPQDPTEFMKGNFGFTSTLLDQLKLLQNKAPVMVSSSIQAALNNPYGLSKKAGEDLMFAYSEETHAKVLVYRFTNVFGKWSRPNYNTVVATFCYNIARDIPITINDRSTQMNLIYIDDLVDELIRALKGDEHRRGNYCEVPVSHQVTLGQIADLLYSFKESRTTRMVPNIFDAFAKKLYSTYLSFLPEDQFKYSLKMNVDQRGSFTEFLKTVDHGQVSINVSKPHITKGNHWHHTKCEKFLVVSGTGIIRFRRMDDNKVIEYRVSGDNLEVLDIPPGYTHNIENIGETDMVTIMWANEMFDPQHPDTHFLEV